MRIFVRVLIFASSSASLVIAAPSSGQVMCCDSLLLAFAVLATGLTVITCELLQQTAIKLCWQTNVCFVSIHVEAPNWRGRVGLQ